MQSTRLHPARESSTGWSKPKRCSECWLGRGFRFERLRGVIVQVRQALPIPTLRKLLEGHDAHFVIFGDAAEIKSRGARAELS
jgi:hypothetical protein